MNSDVHWAAGKEAEDEEGASEEKDGDLDVRDVQHGRVPPSELDCGLTDTARLPRSAKRTARRPVRYGTDSNVVSIIAGEEDAPPQLGRVASVSEVTAAQEDMAERLDELLACAAAGVSFSGHNLESAVEEGRQIFSVGPGTGDQKPGLPTNYRGCMISPDRENWVESMRNEHDGLVAMKVYAWHRREDVPRGHRVLTTKWVYDLKTGPNGEVLRWKSRIVVRGFEQREGLDYGDTFSATAKMTSIRLLLSIAAAECLTLYQWDIKQAFLSAKLPYAVYVEPPEGLKDEGWVWLLRRALYGLHEASSLFGAQLSKTLVMKLGLKKMRADQCVYMWKRPRGSGRQAILILTTWVDDLILGASDTAIKVEFYDSLRGLWI